MLVRLHEEPNHPGFFPLPIGVSTAVGQLAVSLKKPKTPQTDDEVVQCVHEVSRQLFIRTWNATRHNLVPDPTIRAIAILALQPGLRWHDATAITPLVAKLKRMLVRQFIPPPRCVRLDKISL
jgi:hypothetical protein